MHLSDSSTPGANFFLLFALGQLHILVFYILGAFTKTRPSMERIFLSAIILLVILLVTAIGTILKFHLL